MYLQCNSKLTREQINQMFLELLVNPQFEQWNTKTISIILVFAFGYSGCEVRKYAIKLLEEFHQWYANSQCDQYVPNRSNEKMYSKNIIKSMVNYVKNSNENEINQDNNINHLRAIQNLSHMWVIIDQLIYIEKHPLSLYDRFKKFFYLKR